MAEELTRKELFTELGSTGLSRFGGYVAEEWLADLQGTRGVRVYKEMRDSDPVIGAILFAIEMLCRQADWRVDPAGNVQESIEAARFLQSCLDDMSMSWRDVVNEALSMLVFGWSWHEIIYKRRLGPKGDPPSKFDDGKIGWRKIPIRAQETLVEWEFDDSGGIKAMKQSAPPDYQIRRVPIEKSLLFRVRSRKGNPEGISLLRNAYRPWKFKRQIEAIEGIGIERDLAGLPVAWVPPNIASPATAEERASLEAYKRLVTNIRRDQQEGIVMPLAYDRDGKNKLYDLTLLTTGGRRQFDTNAAIERYDSRIAQTVMADFILLGTQKVGSFALSSNKTHLFAVAIGAVLDEIEEVMNTHAIPRLFALNGMDLQELPKLRHGDIEDMDLEELGKYITALSGAGMPLFPNSALEKALLQAAHLPTEGVEESA